MYKNRLSYSYILISLICTFFVIFGVAFVSHITSKSKANELTYLFDITEQKKHNLVEQIKSNWETLNGVAICIAHIEVESIDDLTPMLKKINDENQFLRMGIIQPNGFADLVDIDGTTHENFDFSDMDFFKEALTGKSSISDTVQDAYGNVSINYYGVPVKKDDQIIGVLCAVSDADQIRKLVDVSAFSGGGYSGVVKEDGTYVIRSIHSRMKAEGIEQLDDTASDVNQSILDNLAVGKENTVSYMREGEEQWAAYLPIGINDWFLFSTVPQQVLAGDYNTILGIIFIIGMGVIIFTLFTYRLNMITDKNKRELETLAYEDPLTGHCNYSKFLIDVQERINKKDLIKCAFWHGDLRKFKIFNDLFGYEEGDKVLQYLTKLLEETAAPKELFARVNADNFAGVKCYGSEDELVQWAEKLADAMERYEVHENRKYPFHMVFGIFCVDRIGDELSINDMLNRANMAQKTIKDLGTARYAFYSEQIREQALSETDMEYHMRRALNQGEFQAYIQPKVNIQGEIQIAGGEVLARWKRPGKGIVSPAEFIPLFEKNGFIVELDRYMFQTICKWAQRYLEQSDKPLKLAVNVSRQGLFQEDFPDYYIAMKKKYQLPDGMIELEFTESIALNGAELFRDAVITLQENGFVCSIDDFGAGYSSLNILKELPMQVLKLDMLFFREGADNERSRIVVSNVVSMARALKMRTVAEGVESWDQVEFLQQIGCDVIQGYVFAKPMELAAFEKLLDAGDNWFQRS